MVASVVQSPTTARSMVEHTRRDLSAWITAVQVTRDADSPRQCHHPERLEIERVWLQRLQFLSAPPCQYASNAFVALYRLRSGPPTKTRSIPLHKHLTAEDNIRDHRWPKHRLVRAHRRRAHRRSDPIPEPRATRWESGVTPTRRTAEADGVSTMERDGAPV